jgi:2-polyprenyl-3-methyl-5-hydroxy-6-metoxy-1,4-benzoquinol methylase
MTKSKEVWKKVSDMNIPTNFLLGSINSESLINDPKHLLFTLSRYKFAIKMLSDKKHIIEIGCGEGIGTFMLLSGSKAKITAIDFDEKQIEYAKKNVLPKTSNRTEFICKDLILESYQGKGDGLVCLDVIEHIDPKEEGSFLKNCYACLEEEGVAIFGTPNKFANQYASERSKIGHINMFDPDRLVKTLKKEFRQVFLFSMNDEMLHTGYNKMAHYLVALCVK